MSPRPRWVLKQQYQNNTQLSNQNINNPLSNQNNPELLNNQNIIQNELNVNQNNPHDINPVQENQNILNINSNENLAKENNNPQNKSIAQNSENNNVDKKPVENLIQKEFKYIFEKNNKINQNNYRRRLMHLIFYCILQNIIIIQILW